MFFGAVNHLIVHEDSCYVNHAQRVSPHEARCRRDGLMQFPLQDGGAAGKGSGPAMVRVAGFCRI